MYSFIGVHRRVYRAGKGLNVSTGFVHYLSFWESVLSSTPPLFGRPQPSQQSAK